MHTGASPRVAQALTLGLAAATAGNGWAQGVQATQVDARTIRVTEGGDGAPQGLPRSHPPNEFSGV